MGVGKTERAGLFESRFTKGRRIDATNDRILRSIRVKGGSIRKIGDKWELIPTNAGDGQVPAIPDIEIELTESEEIIGPTENVIVTAEVDETNKHKINHTYKTVNVLPDGDSTQVAAKWDNSAVPPAWKKALPIHDTNDEQSGDLTTGARVVTGAKTGPTGALIQLITKPLGTMGSSLPAGDTTNCALKYQSTGWVKVLPVHGTNDAQSGDLTTGSRVVTGLKTAPNGSLIQLITKPLGTMGGLQVGNMTQITFVTAVQFSSSKIQYKTRTGYVYSPGTESGWTDVLTFTSFSD